ncbi:MFS transporter [Streptomyces sp. DH-12]|uniref:MFS transporter n=1 Tax=unclassified Streptomyces TaxID=2593676 RepID=UPI000CCE9BB4|nr:MFS transporter [Streptomyces sp. DH-12]PNV33073.1 MFS transporter [Streptomyces sp. DH-12]
MSDTLLPPPRLRRPAIAALGVLALALGALQSVVEPALPLLQRELGLGPSEGALVANTLLVTGAVLTPVAGKLGDRYGGKRVLMRLMAVVAAGGLLAGLAPGLPVLLLGQILQGAMVGVLPLSFILVRAHLPAGRTQAAIGVVIALFTGGGMAGMLGAGLIAEHLSWHWMFVLPTLAVVAATVSVARLMPSDAPVRHDESIDWPGVVLLSATLLAFMLGLMLLTDGGLPPLAAGALLTLVAVLAAAWVRVERRAVSPMVDLRMLARPVMWQACLLTLLVTTALGMVILLLPQLLALSGDGYGFGASTTGIGLYLLPGAVAGAVSDAVGGVAARRFGARAVVVVAALATAAAMFALAARHDAAWQLALARALTAFAAGIATTALLAGTATAVGPGDTGIATSLLVVTRVIGLLVGSQIASALLDAGIDPGTGLPAEAAFTTGFAVTGVTAALGLLLVRATRGARAAASPETAEPAHTPTKEGTRS